MCISPSSRALGLFRNQLSLFARRGITLLVTLAWKFKRLAMSQHRFDDIARAIVKGELRWPFRTPLPRRASTVSTPTPEQIAAPMQNAQTSTHWSGPVQNGNEKFTLFLELQERQGAFTGYLSVVDPENGNLVPLGDISGMRMGQNISLQTTSQLTLTLVETTNRMTGTIVFPPRKDEPGITVAVDLAISGSNTYLPLITR
jgi:hypothetical protein